MRGGGGAAGWKYVLIEWFARLPASRLS
jgi:hypothetical protein